mmetsp:Transcript_3837/g.10444  ORF Transcript_3837/g.10444 Transcript_3837/m.10444 type:complete len:82 (-) Transcript_3837:349-594(-)
MREKRGSLLVTFRQERHVEAVKAEMSASPIGRKSASPSRTQLCKQVQKLGLSGALSDRPKDGTKHFRRYATFGCTRKKGKK